MYRRMFFMGLFVLMVILTTANDIGLTVIINSALPYFAGATLVTGLFTGSAWLCINIVAKRFYMLLEKVPNFNLVNVMNVWELYFKAWRVYTAVLGTILALLSLYTIFIG